MILPTSSQYNMLVLVSSVVLADDEHINMQIHTHSTPNYVLKKKIWLSTFKAEGQGNS